MTRLEPDPTTNRLVLGDKANPALIVNPEVLLQILGYLDCALRHTPATNDFHLDDWQPDPDTERPQHEWEVWQVDYFEDRGYLVGTGNTPVAAMLDAVIALMNREDIDEGGLSYLPDTEEDLTALRLAIQAAQAMERAATEYAKNIARPDEGDH